MTETLPHSFAVPRGAIFSTRENHQLARLDTRRTKSSVAIVCAHGDIDGTNAHTLTEHSLADLVRCRGLILDLTRLEFFGAAGFSALHRISVSCARAGMGWALVPGAAVSLLLRICDPDGLLPAVDTVSAALASLQGSACNADHPEKTRQNTTMKEPNCAGGQANQTTPEEDQRLQLVREASRNNPRSRLRFIG